MKMIIYYSKPIGKEKIILELTTLKEEKKESKTTNLEERKKLVNKDYPFYTLTKLEERNNLVNMEDPYWQWYFKK